jgi:hypothetical protein
VALSLNYDLRSIQRSGRIYAINRRLRRLGIEPTPPGISVWRDRTKLTTAKRPAWYAASPAIPQRRRPPRAGDRRPHKIVGAPSPRNRFFAVRRTQVIAEPCAAPRHLLTAPTWSSMQYTNSNLILPQHSLRSETLPDWHRRYRLPRWARERRRDRPTDGVFPTGASSQQPTPDLPRR